MITKLRAALSALNLAVCTTREIEANYDTFAQAEDDLRSVIAEMESAEPVAWLHDVTTADEYDQALSFSKDNFPLEGVAGWRSEQQTPLYTHPQPKAEPVQEPVDFDVKLLFSRWYDSLPYGEPSYKETFEAGYRAAAPQAKQGLPSRIEPAEDNECAYAYADGLNAAIAAAEQEVEK